MANCDRAGAFLLIVTNVLRYPVHKVGDSRINSGVLSLSASNAPRHDTGLHPLALVDH